MLMQIRPLFTGLPALVLSIIVTIALSPQKNLHHFFDNRINKPIHSTISFIAPSLAATAFGAIILRSSLTGLRMTAGKPTPERVMQMRPAPSIIYRCYDRWKGGMVKRFPETST
jgi:hypothetical protein